MGMVMNYIMTALNYLVRIIRPSTFFILRACLAQLLRQLHMKLCQTVIFGLASRLKPSTKLLRASTRGAKPTNRGFRRLHLHLASSLAKMPSERIGAGAGGGSRAAAGATAEREEGAEGPAAPRRSGRGGAARPPVSRAAAVETVR